ncbi:MAG UNVERIFIED_CONTAM: hypothetical protein LVT10_07750 [Anaerolineae bacterium]
MVRPIDVILHHAHIITLDPAHPHATALAIHNGRILAVGNDDEILPSPHLTHAPTTWGACGHAEFDGCPYPLAKNRHRPSADHHF